MKTWKHLMKAPKILHGSFIGLLVFILFGCASTPPSSASPSVVAGMDLDVAIKNASAQMETRIPAGTMIALVSVASPSTAFSTQVLTRLESSIVSSGKLVVVDRANLDKVREEQGFQLSGEVDDESAKSIGKLLGAGAIVTGSLTDLGDVYSLTLKAINIETATVAVSYLADLTKTTRIETLLATRDGAVSGGTSMARTQPATTTPTAPAAPRQFTVTYNANGASGNAPSAQTIQDGESITIPDAGSMTSSRGSFGGWNTRADGNGTAYAAGVTFVVNANTQLYARWIERVYRIGDAGPAGGIIFYDKGNSSSGWRYLEAAPTDKEFNAQWGNVNVQTGEDIGAGKANTQRIATDLEQKGHLIEAAHRCTRLNINGYTDWFLPSKNELAWMYINLKENGIGGFSSDWYWSSSQTNISRASCQNFTDGKQAGNAGGAGDFKTKNWKVRAVRQF